MFVTTAIAPATLLVSAQIKPMIVPTTSTTTITASQYRIRRLVMGPSLLPLRHVRPPTRLPKSNPALVQHLLRNRVRVCHPEAAGLAHHCREPRDDVKSLA